MQGCVDTLREAFPNSILHVSTCHGIPVVKVDKEGLPTLAHYIHYNRDLQGTLSLLWAVDHHPRQDRYELFYLFTLKPYKDWLVLTIDLHGDDRLFRSITPAIHAAKWYERELRDMFGLIAQGHPDLRRLVRHEHWPKGTHPLRKDFPWDTVLTREQGQYHFRHIEGEGVFEVPVGPIHAGVIEPGHFRFSVAGEPVLQLEVRHFWKHRGVEKLFEQRHLLEGVPLAERISGDTTVGHALAYCEAVETLLGLKVPLRATFLRSLFLELERLHNHLGDVGAICNDTAFSLAHAHCGRLKERVMQLNDRLTGSRFLRGAVVVGGVQGDVAPAHFDRLVEELDAIEQDFTDLESILAANPSLNDRLDTTGVLEERTAWDHAALGYVARASGLDRDLRRDRPFAAYHHVKTNVTCYRYGDVRARMRVRIDEIHDSIRIIREIRLAITPGSIKIESTTVPRPGDWALSAVEGWRGEILCFVMAGEDLRIHRCKVRDPSFVNWPIIQLAVLGNIIPDFPLINKSFNLSYAGNDL